MSSVSSDKSPLSRDVVKVFGERNTGTNAFAKLIRRNSGSHVLPTQIAELRGISAYFGRALRRLAPQSMHESLTDWVFAKAATRDAWKHCATYFSEEQLAELAKYPTFVMIRHPASWLVGLQRKPYHALQPTPGTLSEFLNVSWQTVARDGLKGQSFRPAELYNQKLKSYLWFETALQEHGGHVEFIRFEDFVMDQLSVFGTVAHLLKDPGKEPKIIASSTKKSGKSAEDYARSYREQDWAESIDDEARGMIKSEIDWDAASRFYGPDDWRRGG